MKKLFYLFAILTMAFGFTACGSDDDAESQQDENVNVVLTYTISGENGTSMSRAASEFTPFYEKIVSGELMYDNYSITFTNSETGLVFKTEGKWSQKHMITLPKGKYNIKGGSKETLCSNKCLITIDTTCDISASGTVALPAEYNCFLFAVKNDVYSSGTYYLDNLSGGNSLTQFNDYLYYFINASNVSSNAYIFLSASGLSQRIYFKSGTFQNGKYYIFETIPGSYSIPEMVSGM